MNTLPLGTSVQIINHVDHDVVGIIGTVEKNSLENVVMVTYTPKGKRWTVTKPIPADHLRVI